MRVDIVLIVAFSCAVVIAAATPREAALARAAATSARLFPSAAGDATNATKTMLDTFDNVIASMTEGSPQHQRAVKARSDLDGYAREHPSEFEATASSALAGKNIAGLQGRQGGVTGLTDSGIDAQIMKLLSDPEMRSKIHDEIMKRMGKQ